jgi:predicted nucleotidyltransferase component of viral defense system
MFDQTLPQASRSLLRDLNHELSQFGFYLGGGSGLALQLGHRISEDLDFFTVQPFEPSTLSRYLETKHRFEATLVSPGTLYCILDSIKLSFIHYAVPLVYPPIQYESLQLADWRDILAEKFKTLSQRGAKKDFYDLYACFAFGNLKIDDGVKMLSLRFSKTGINYYHILKSLTYFDDAEREPELLLVKPITWQAVKDFFLTNLKEFEKHLLTED